MKCPHCNWETPDGKKCSICGKGLSANSKASIPIFNFLKFIIPVVVIIIFVVLGAIKIFFNDSNKEKLNLFTDIDFGMSEKECIKIEGDGTIGTFESLSFPKIFCGFEGSLNIYFSTNIDKVNGIDWTLSDLSSSDFDLALEKLCNFLEDELGEYKLDDNGSSKIFAWSKGDDKIELIALEGTNGNEDYYIYIRIESPRGKAISEEGYAKNRKSTNDTNYNDQEFSLGIKMMEKADEFLDGGCKAADLADFSDKICEELDALESAKNSSEDWEILRNLITPFTNTVALDHSEADIEQYRNKLAKELNQSSRRDKE